VEALPDLPPKVPEELAELDRALQLLGALCQAGGNVKNKHRSELETLLGCPVTQQLASHWKTHLKEIRRDLAEEVKKKAQGSAPIEPSSLRRMTREEICDVLVDEASDGIEVVDSLTFGLRNELGVTDHAVFEALESARQHLDRVHWLLEHGAIRTGVSSQEAHPSEG
jgi:metal-sulfur cluster biosynthetic enzyme